MLLPRRSKVNNTVKKIYKNKSNVVRAGQKNKRTKKEKERKTVVFFTEEFNNKKNFQKDVEMMKIQFN